MNKYYLRIEAVNLDYSVYDTHDISTIRGGSFMLIDAFQKLKFKLSDKIESISTTASIGLFKIKSSEKEIHTIVQYILNELNDLTGQVGIFVSAFILDDERRPFNHTIQELTAQCRWQQYQKLSLILPKPIDTEEFCYLDRIRPANQSEKIGLETKKVSDAVKVRRDSGKILRKKIYRTLLGTPIVNSYTREEIIFTDNIEALSTNIDAGNLNGKIAYIHIDGNRFGGIRDSVCVNEEKYRLFQQKIQVELRNYALKELITFASKVKLFQTADHQIRLETLLWGGDEIDWIVPAWQAINVLKIFYETTKNMQFDGINLTHAAGVVFAHHNLPILQLRRYAESMCTIAKKKIPIEPEAIQVDDNKILFYNLYTHNMLSGTIEKSADEYSYPAKCEEFIIHAAHSNLGRFENNLKIIRKYLPKNRIYKIVYAIRNRNDAKMDEIIKRTKDLLGQKKWGIVKPAIEEILENNNHRWLMIQDLMDYVGENQ